VRTLNVARTAPASVVFNRFTACLLWLYHRCMQRKHGSFIEYICEKDPRIKRCTLPFEGRNTLLYMTTADYALPRQAVARPDYNPCAQAAKAGDLELLQMLRREGCPWNTEVQQCGAWAGHLHVLRYMYALANGCEPWSWDICEAAARHGGHAHVVEWAEVMRNVDRCEVCSDVERLPHDVAAGLASAVTAAPASAGQLARGGPSAASGSEPKAPN
jgi:hypothetical protein